MAKKEVKIKRASVIDPDYRVRRYEDGKYHWMYDFHMLKNPSILFDVLKVMGMSVIIVAFFIFVTIACDGGLHPEDLGFILQLVGILSGIMLVLSLLGYLLYAALSGWVYTVHFIMDETGVVHEQSPKAKKVAERVGCLTSLVGLLARKPGVVGSGMIASGRTSMRTDFSSVRKVKAVRWMNTINVNERFEKNRVYADNEDFDFVYQYISSHCPNAKIC